tara:strand:+ start:191 stop:688 length:498 start_codon:yes stop_codon:yes gene_type:complete
MIKLRSKKFIIYFIIISLVFLIDRLTKIYVLKLAESSDYLNILVNNFLNIILIWNEGIGFGLLSFEDSFIYNSITVLIVIINIIILFLIIKSDNLRSVFYSFIFGGSIGNLFDRIYYSAVPDFIDLNYNGFHWFIFNFADIFITLGIICLIFVEFLDYKRLKNEK